MTDNVTTALSLAPIVLATVAPAAPTETTLAVWWLLGLAGAAVVVNNILAAWEKITSRFSERESKGPEYQHRKDCERIHADDHNQLAATRESIEERIETLRSEFKHDLSNLHDKVNRSSERVSEIMGEIKRIGARNE
jgi:hypothetical protein